MKTVKYTVNEHGMSTSWCDRIGCLISSGACMSCGFYRGSNNDHSISCACPDGCFDLDPDQARAVAAEYSRARSNYPSWPISLVECVSLMIEDAGEVVQAANNHVFHGGDLADVEVEVIQTAAMCFRLLDKLDNIRKRG